MFAQQAALAAYARAAVLFDDPPIARPPTASSASSRTRSPGRAAASMPRWAWPRASPASTSASMRARPARRSRASLAYYDCDRRARSALALADRGRRLGAARAQPAGRRLPPCRAGRGRALSRRQCRDGHSPAGAASLDRRAQMARRRQRRPAISSPRPSSTPRPAASSPRPRPTPGICPSRSSSARTMSRRRASSPCSPPIPARRAIARSPRPAWAISPRRRCSMPTASCPTCCWPRRNCSNEPVHVTVVGPRTIRAAPRSMPPRSRYPLADKRAEWWDKREGQLGHHDVDYPDFPDGPGGLRLHAQLLLAAGDRSGRDSRAARPPAARHRRSEFRYTGA